MTESLSQRAKRLAGGQKKPEAVKSEKPKKSYYQKKGGNGGARAGSGRKPEEERKSENRQGMQDFAAEEIKVKLPDATGQVREVKMSRTQVVRMRLFEAASKGDMRAIEEFDDRTMGRAAQPIVGSDAEPIVLKIDM